MYASPVAPLLDPPEADLSDNHKPELSSETSPEQARLKPALPDSTSSYELAFQDGDAKYAYAGTRTVGDNQYILYFDPSRKVFVLDRVDSTFNMNVTRTPDTSDPEALRRRFEQLGSEPEIVARGPERPAAPPKTGKAAPKRKVAPKKKREEKPKGLEVSEPARGAEKKKKEKRDESEEEDEDDDDDPLQVEYPGSERRQNDFSPAFPEHTFGLRRFSDFAEKLRESGNELDDERSTSSEGGLNNFRLPSPVSKGGGAHDDSEDDDEVEMEDVPPVAREDGRSQRELEAELEAGLESGLRELDEGQGDLERDLEAELENGLMMGNSGQDADAESEVSEED